MGVVALLFAKVPPCLRRVIMVKNGYYIWSANGDEPTISALETMMEQALLAVLAGVLIVTGGVALVTSLVGMSVVLYRRFKATPELTAIPGESGSSESA